MSKERALVSAAGVKSDRWIRKMALEHRMIEPFCDRQVRDGVISYGLSSYGYDLRIADEFRIFTNLNTTIVDPKSFDTKSLVDFKGPVCIIPPNSFALGRSVEYFRIPRTVITICLGKCVVGDTQVLDAATGRLRDIADVVERAGATASLARGAVEPAEVSEGTRQGVLPVYELVTRTGRKITATPNHPLLTFTGWRPLGGALPGDRIGVARRIPIFGSRAMSEWEVDLLGLVIAGGRPATPGRRPGAAAADPVRCENVARAAGLRWGSPAESIPPAVVELPAPLLRRFLRCLFSGGGAISVSGAGARLEYSSTSERLARDVQHLLLRFGVIAMLSLRDPASGRGAHVLSITSKEAIARFAGEIGFVPGSEKARRLEHALELIGREPRQESSADTLPREAWRLLAAACTSRGLSCRKMGIESAQPVRSVSRRLTRELAARLGDEALAAVADSDIFWDTVREKRFLGFRPVYDLTLPGTANFIANDIFVHNSTYARCGIITNVTPFEPEWEGFVTLEISNTTPLPARIYANEGIAQVLFFESDEVCERSYADKKGKYQGQIEVTLPRI